MISLLRGRPTVKKEMLIVDVNGVGYGVMANAATLQKASSQEEISLNIYTYVREDKIELYGFATPEEQMLFELLISVSGVGPKTALAITEKGSQALIEAIQQADVRFFTKVPRVGKKSAQKIIIELKSKLGGLKDLDLQPLTGKNQEAAEALQSLGFAEEEIEQVIGNLNTEDLALEEIVQQAIKLMGKNKL